MPPWIARIRLFSIPPAPSIRIAKRFPTSTCIHGISSWKRRDPLPMIRRWEDSLPFSPFFPHLAIVSRSLLPYHCLLRFSPGCPGGPYESFNSIFPPTPLFRATRVAVRRPSRSIYSARPGPDPIFPRYEIIPNTYNLDDGTGVSTICYLSREAEIGPCTQQTAICVS